MNVHPTYEVVSTLHLPTQGDPTVVAIDPEGSLIAVGTADGHVLVWCLLSYELLCQTSPPPNECGLTGTQVTNMTWMPNGLLAFARRNGLMGMLLVGKVRNEFRAKATAYRLLPSNLSKLCPLQFTTTCLCSQWLTAIPSACGLPQPIMKSGSSDGNGAIVSLPTVRTLVSPDSRPQGHTFDIHPEDRIIAKRVAVSSEEERPVTVTSLNWIKKSATVAYLVVSFLHHHVEYVA